MSPLTRTESVPGTSLAKQTTETKVRLASLVRQNLLSLNLAQAEAAALLGLKQPKVSALINGKLTGFSVGKLMELLTRLGDDVKITVRKAPRTGEAKIHVIAA